ncbi:hypothetical protein GQ600_5296 [Phytophthora cactorum]|nr:hypothetical protein GQ600_5296 [Phytophthora cactorum]
MKGPIIPSRQRLEAVEASSVHGRAFPVETSCAGPRPSKVLMDEIIATRAKREAHESPLNTNMTRFSRHLVVDPVRIPWEMTVPVTTTSRADALSNQRKLKPSIRTNIGLLRDQYETNSTCSQLHWAQTTGPSVFRKANS